MGHSLISQHPTIQPTVDRPPHTDRNSPGQVPTQHTGTCQYSNDQFRFLKFDLKLYFGWMFILNRHFMDKDNASHNGI